MSNNQCEKGISVISPRKKQENFNEQTDNTSRNPDVNGEREAAQYLSTRIAYFFSNLQNYDNI